MLWRWEGTLNVLKHHQIVPGALGQTAEDVNTFFGNQFETIPFQHRRFFENCWSMSEKACLRASKVAIQRNAFGDVVAEYRATVHGEVATIARDALSEPGSRVMQILYNDSNQA